MTKELRIAFVVGALSILGCEGPEGPQGPPGGDGTDGTNGNVGPAGVNGSDGLSPWFTMPGVDVSIDSLTMTSTSAIVAFTIKDPAGIPLDREGRLTQGPVSVVFVLAQLDEDGAGEALQYTAYTTRTQMAPNGNSAIQATTESNGTFETISVAEGQYRYTFAAPLTGFDAARTQTVLVSARRTVDNETATDTETSSVKPNGGTVVDRSVVADASCTTCHGELEGHGGRYHSTKQCVLCHSPQTSDPDTGNTVDFKVMVHKIHRGEELPSVIGGTPYQIIGFNQSVHDFSTVAFPQPIQKCTTCHEGGQADAWRERPAMDACRSCHDNISFTAPPPAGQILHCGGTQPPDAPCAVCHPPSGSIAGITEKHALLTDASQVAIAITDAPQTAAGSPPSLTFRVTVDGAPRNILATGQGLSSLRATLAGPNTDFAAFWQTTVQGSGSTGTLTAVDAADGVFRYDFPATTPVPVGATGSYTLGLEGYITGPTPPTPSCPVGPAPAAPRYATSSPTRAFAVTDAVAIPRRQIIDPAKCNNCHSDLSFHGGGRKGAGYCLMCHNPSNANDERIARFEDSTVVAESVDFRVMIHKIHNGEELSQPYTIYGFPPPSPTNPAGTPASFAEMRYPRPTSQCIACHLDTTWNLPVAGTASSTLAELMCTEPTGQDADSYCTSPFWNITQLLPVRPEAAACTACHDQPFVAAHAAVNTTPAGVESCTTCHGPGAAYDVNVVHSP